ncbi:hypothetical protein QWY82_18425 [Simiduia curdlanivorans]|uniref:Uncharacterized protein n=1 Tax=Simiduia curdlanivorans TaxID=1492769 RepID=A0ABV8VCB9_9GAMM|nr:hypothetical protein [Simiduia curdlanivorans]MDN3640288.1 hypothetical protein [Simiduia curdlanivorans]MDN3640781.1 hypothetical protein [Simiduia curdlanivorans]
MIPIDLVHELLPNFGITSPSNLYERRVKDDGFEEDDVLELLEEGPFIVSIDWRAWLQDELEVISKILLKLGARLEFSLNGDGNAGLVRIGDKESNIKYEPNDDDGCFDNAMLSISKVLPSDLEVRSSVHNGQNDTSCYAILPKSHWEKVDEIAGDLISTYFQAFEVKYQKESLLSIVSSFFRKT